MKSSLWIALSTLFFYTPSYALDQRELAEFWMNSRYQNCGEAFLMQIETRNSGTLADLLGGSCAQIDKNNLQDAKTRECLVKLNKNLQLFLNRVPNAAENQGCTEKADFVEYINGDSKAIKPAEQVSSASVSCSPADAKEGFKLYSSNGKNVCVREYKCKYKFRFGQSEPLDPANYVFRCLAKNSVQSDCDKMNFYECEGKEVSYSKLSLFGVIKADPVPVKASKAPAAQ